MEDVAQFLQTYGLGIALGGGLLLLLNRGGKGGCCGLPQQRRTGRSPDPAAFHSAPTEAEAPDHPTSLAELQAAIAESRAQQEALARQIAVLEADPAEATASAAAVGGEASGAGTGRKA